MTINENIDWELIDDIKNSETPPARGSAVKKGGHKSVDPVLDSFLESLKQDSEGKDLSIISNAVVEGNAEQLDFLLQVSFSPNIADATVISPLQRAADSRKHELCIKLLDAGADHENVNFSPEDIVLRAVEENKTKLAISLIKTGVDPRRREYKGLPSLIHIAAENYN